MLLSSINTSYIHVYSFNESLNEVTQTCEMDLYVRCGDVACSQVKMRYFGSSFMGHGTYTDILQYFDEITKDLNLHTYIRSPWMGRMLIWNFIKNLCKNAKMRIIIHWLTLGVVVYMLFTEAWELEWMIRSGP